MTSAPSLDTRWEPLSAESVAELFGGTSARWWISGGVALDRWLGEPIRDRVNIDVSTTRADVAQLVAALPARFSVWIPDGDNAVMPWPDAADAVENADLQPVRVHDDETGAWVLQMNVEDGSPRGWLYLRDPRLQLPWDRAVLDLDGIPTGAPEVQLVWKALRPRPDLRPVVLDIPLRLPEGGARLFLAATLNLLPGTLSAGLQGGHLRIHVLDQRFPVEAEVRAVETRIARLLGLPLEAA